MSKQATRGHLTIGIILVLIALLSLIVSIIRDQAVVAVLVFFFGVWGGVELGRYLENFLSQQK